MKINIKVLNGQECIVEVKPDTTVLEMKKDIEDILNIPIINQKLLQLGRTLIDEKTIDSYPNIKDGSKLTLVVRKPDPLKEVIFRCFQKYYNEPLAETLTAEFMLDFEKKIKQFSLDDLERIAGGIITNTGAVE